MNEKGAGGADCAGDDRNSEKSSSSSRLTTGGETAVCEGVCELDLGGGESGDITPIDLDANESLPSDCFWEEDLWESMGKAESSVGLGARGGVE